MCKVTACSVSTSTVPPRILKLMDPERHHFTCVPFIVRSNPPPTLRWLHNGVEIQETSYIYTDAESYLDYKEGCLLINNPTHYNNGNYTLEAENELGLASETIVAHFLPTPDALSSFHPTLAVEWWLLAPFMADPKVVQVLDHLFPIAPPGGAED
ncbi:NTRK3 factor, partial [Polypterus senegalus]